jgi:tRNA dimethylallyltransferase
MIARFPVICGPTASGKSALAVELALLNQRRGQPAEIVTADAFQVYRGMDIGTAKPTLAERRGVVHHLIDIADPSEDGPGRGRFTVEEWLTHAEETITQLRMRGVMPIVVGGTHLYIKALMEGLFEGPGADPALRAELTVMEPSARRARLQEVDPRAAERIHPNDLRRTIRALEVYALTGKPISEHQRQWDQGVARKDALLVALQWPVDELNPRINARVKAMMEAGLLEETRALHIGGKLGPQAREALGYKQLLAHIQRGEPLDECIERVKIETRRFAKNQRTWLRRLGAQPGAVAIDAVGQTSAELADRVIAGR